MNKKLVFELLKNLKRIRMVEEAIAEKYAEQKMRCPTHLSIGQEAVAVGVCAALSKDDLTISGHRAHAHYLAKGGDLKKLIAELYGKETGCCGGFGGSMHLLDESVGFMGSTARNRHYLLDSIGTLVNYAFLILSIAVLSYGVTNFWKVRRKVKLAPKFHKSEEPLVFA